jgi:hypothetical protein
MGVERTHQPKVAQRGPPAEQECVLGKVGVELPQESLEPFLTFHALAQ